MKTKCTECSETQENGQHLLFEMVCVIWKRVNNIYDKMATCYKTYFHGKNLYCLILSVYSLNDVKPCSLK